MHWGLATIGTLFVLFPAAFILYVNVGGISKILKKRQESRVVKRVLSDMTCSINADCPEGYICVGGRCIPDGA
jgi:hypothetical protein